MTEPRWIDKRALLLLHDEDLAEHGGLPGLRDEGMLDSALARPLNLLAYGKPTMAALAASYAFGIARNHPFADGNKRAALLATGLFLAGDSAGGNLAAAVVTSLRDEPGAVPAIGQWLIYPAADPAVRYPSYDQFCQGHLLTKEGMDWFEDSYAGPKDDWRYSPLLAGAAGLPPTFVTTASLDPIRDQGRAYAARCAEAGVETIYLEAEGTLHGFLNLRKAIPSSNEDFAKCLSYLRPWVSAHDDQRGSLPPRRRRDAAEPGGQRFRRRAHR